MKTPLMELIEKLNERKNVGYAIDLTDSDESMIQINLAIRDATELLEKEREVIEKAYMSGTAQFAVDARIDYPLTASDYYTKTFTHESK